jgi:protein-export membrane protein SecD
MLHFARWKTIAIIVACLAGLIGAFPNFFDKQRILGWPWPTNKSINLGLDLQGGAHFLLGMDTSVLRKDWLDNVREEARRKLREAKIAASVGVTEGRVRAQIQNPTEVEAALKELRSIAQTIDSFALTGSSGLNLDVKIESSGIIALTPTEPGLRERETKGVGAAIETLRRRVDPTGTKEATIVRQGRERILIQVPGIEDPKEVDEIKARVKKAAKMTFQWVHPSISVEDARQTRTPLGYKIYPPFVDEGATRRETTDELLEERAVVSGEELVDAQPGFDSRTNEPIVTFRFNTSGSRKFGSETSKNVGRRFAVVLDGQVVTAPVVRESIGGGTGQISGNFTVETANRLAILLRSGALPAPLTIIEERTVGPSLGADSIKAGKIATIIGTLLVVGFMLFAYGLFGIFAIIAVAINIAMILAMMSWIGSTLTLPGIAGILLTVGMAVDANVLIYERIREELRNKKTPISAIEAGFNRALATIIDANLTTLIAGLAMFALGSGPIRGFAVTLSLGILTTVFTAFTVTRLLVSWWLKSQTAGKMNARIEAPI